jgi:hypothetical protein
VQGVVILEGVLDANGRADPSTFGDRFRSIKLLWTRSGGGASRPRS